MQRRIKRDQLVVLQILEQVKAHLDHPWEANRLLRELGKFYDPVASAAIVDGPARKRLIDLLERGERSAVAAAVDRYIEDYLSQLPETARPKDAVPSARAATEEPREA